MRQDQVEQQKPPTQQPQVMPEVLLPQQQHELEETPDWAQRLTTQLLLQWEPWVPAEKLELPYELVLPEQLAMAQISQATMAVTSLVMASH